MAKGKHARKSQSKKHRILKVKIQPDHPILAEPLHPSVPEPIRDLHEAFRGGLVSAIVFKPHIEPTLWEKFKGLFGATPPPDGRS